MARIKKPIFTFANLEPNILAVANSNLSINGLTNISTTGVSIAYTEPDPTNNKEASYEVGEVSTTPPEEEGGEATQTVRTIAVSGSMGANSLVSYLTTLNNEVAQDSDYDIILDRVMKYIIKDPDTGGSISNIFSDFIFGYNEANPTKKLGNSLRDYMLTPKFAYRYGDTGFSTMREAIDAYVSLLGAEGYTLADKSFKKDIFRNLSKELFNPSIAGSGLSDSRVPLVYGFIRIGNDDNSVFGDSRDLTLVKSLNHSFPELSASDKATYISLLAKGVLKAIREEHYANVEKLKGQFMEDLGNVGLSLTDVKRFDFSRVNWNELLNDPNNELYGLAQATKDGLVSYFTGVGDAVYKLFTSAEDVMGSLALDIRLYPEDYLIKEEITKWLIRAGDTPYEDYSDSRLLYFVKALGAYLNSARAESDKFNTGKLTDASGEYEADAELVAANYRHMLSVLRASPYKDYFTGPVYGASGA